MVLQILLIFAENFFIKQIRIWHLDLHSLAQQAAIALQVLATIPVIIAPPAQIAIIRAPPGLPAAAMHHVLPAELPIPAIIAPLRRANDRQVALRQAVTAHNRAVAGIRPANSRLNTVSTNLSEPRKCVL